MSSIGTVSAVCVSDRRGIQKKNIHRANLVMGWGVEGDAHGGDWHRQVSLLSQDKVDDFIALGAQVGHGDFGENLVVAGIDFRSLPVGTKLQCGSAVLQLTQIGKECHTHCQIYHKMGDCIMPREGVFARVLQEGAVQVGDTMTVLPWETSPYQAAVITLSDRGFAGKRTDQSGPLIAKMLLEAGYQVAEQQLLPDNREQLQQLLIDLSDRRRVDLILTTGGTGFSPRDVAPEATSQVAERNAPGIAEAMRTHSMTITPRAMLGRGVSVIRGGTLIVNLPGSPKAVAESLSFILPQLEHGLQILRGQGGECGEPPSSTAAKA